MVVSQPPDLLLPEPPPPSTAIFSLSSSPPASPCAHISDSQKSDLAPPRNPSILMAPLLQVATVNLDGKQTISDLEPGSTLNSPQKSRLAALSSSTGKVNGQVWSSNTATQPSVPLSNKKLSYKAVVKAGVQHVNDLNSSVDKEEENRRFPWAARMDPSMRNLYLATTPTYMEDGTPKVTIPSHVVLLKGLENQREFVIGQFYRCSSPPGGLTHAVVNRIWGRKCKIFTRKLSDMSYLFHIPDDTTRSWVLQRGLWHVDHCLMFVAPWSPASTLSMHEISTIPVWVTLKNIPNQLYSIAGISHIASGLGAPMATSKPRLDPTLMGEAKIMVEVELNKPFPQKIAASDKKGSISMVDVEYSWIPSKCGRCGHLSHKESRCLLSPISQVKTTPLGNLQSSSGVIDSFLSKTNVAPSTSPSPGTEIAIVSIPNLKVDSHYVSTPQLRLLLLREMSLAHILDLKESHLLKDTQPHLLVRS